MKNKGVGMEIRVYFECLEQAYHYILPFVKEGINQSKIKEIPIKLVRSPKSFKNSEKCAIHSIYSLTTPDFLITICEGSVEVPIILGEFSESVLTEDHELQRAIGGVASVLSGCLYLKISGQKLSLKEHGGKKEFNPLTVGRILDEVFGFKGFIVGTWPTMDKNPYILKRDPNYLSCPAKGLVPLAEKTITLAVKETVDNYADIISSNKTVEETVVRGLLNANEFQNYQKDIRSAMSLADWIQDWRQRKYQKGESRIRLDQDSLVVKINRFSHAADPDRGMLIFSSFVIPVSTVFVRYVVKDDSVKTRKTLIDRFIKQSLSEGLPFDFITNVERFIKNNLTDNTLDLTELLQRITDKWYNNKVLFSIFLFSDGMIIHDRDQRATFRLKWDRKSIFKIDKNKFKESLIRLFDSRRYVRPSSVKKIERELAEDEVTYVVIHQILKPNNFDIISVSYPGAQGDAAILPEKHKGREQKRMYVDVMAWLPPDNSKQSNELALEESKCSFNKKEIEETIAKLDKIRRERIITEALIETLQRMGENRELRRIVIGVAFGIDTSLTTSWQPAKADFLVRITKRDKWDVAYFGNKLRCAFKYMEGDVRLPQVYEVVSNITTENTSLMKYFNE